MSSPDQPFELHGGNNEQTSIYNRISAIDRINFLSGIDLRDKSAAYLQALDLEMWTRWYKNEPPNKKIDETFCQRAAEVIKAMEGKDVAVNKEAYDAAKTDHQKKLESNDGSQHAQSSPQDAGKAEQNSGGVCESSPPRSDTAP